ncbi:MAG: tryptophan 2,3-dioxygenase family protein [Planctomycetota bacterium]
MPATYWDYLQLDSLLALQGGLERDENELSNDELRFITIHQIDELWMKVALRELESARDLFKRDHVPETALSSAAQGLRRIQIVFELMADHFRLMETMRTRDYLEFRDKLSPASGFQSAQMRELEILMGLEESQRIPFGGEKSHLRALEGPTGDSTALQKVKRRLAEPETLKSAVYRWLSRAPIDGSVPGDDNDDEVVAKYIDRFLDSQRRGQEQRIAEVLEHQALEPSDHERLKARYEQELQGSAAWLRAEDVDDEADRRLQRRLRAALLFIESNRDLALLSWPGEILDNLVACEQASVIFRQRHARMVERVIGRRVGTGGSAGVDYLDETALRYRVFPEVWQVRGILTRAELDPEISNEDTYGLRFER